jgi:hypothetical protein
MNIEANTEVGLLGCNTVRIYMYTVQIPKFRHFSPEDGDSMFIRNVRIYFQVHFITTQRTNIDTFTAAV